MGSNSVDIKTAFELIVSKDKVGKHRVFD